MTDHPDPETDERAPTDSWRALATDADAVLMGIVEVLAESRSWNIPDDVVALDVRRRALLAAEEHAPTFHIRKTRVLDAQQEDPMDPQSHNEWSWHCVAANNEPLGWSGELYVNQQWAINRAHLFADPMGARVVVDDEGSGE